MSVKQNEAFTAGFVHSDEKIAGLVTTFEDNEARQKGNAYTVADVSMNEYDYREESADRDGSSLSAADDVAHISVSANKPYGNPRPGTSQMNDSQRVYSMWTHYAQIMSRKDASTVALLNELAYVGYKAARETAEKIAAQKNTAVIDKVGFSDQFLVVAKTEGEAKIVRAWIDLAMKHVTDGNDFNDKRALKYYQTTLPSNEELSKVLFGTRPGLETEVLDEAGRVAQAGTSIGILVAPGMEQVALDFIRTAGQPVVIGGGLELRKQIIAEFGRPDKDKVYGASRGVKITEPTGPAAKRDDAINEKIAYQADRVVIFSSEDEGANQSMMQAVARAFQRGTLAAAFDEAGEPLSHFRIGEHADLLYPPKSVLEHNQEIARFSEVMADSPQGRLILSLLPKMTRTQIDSLSNTQRSVGDLLSLARTEEGKAALYGEFKLTSETMAAMGSSHGITAAGAAFDRIKIDCEKNGVHLVGPESYPEKLRRDPAAPIILYVKALDPQAFAKVGPHLLMAGDNNVPEFMQKRMTELATKVIHDGSAVSMVEGRGQPRLPAEAKPAVLWLTTGHGHYDVQSKGLDWSAERLPVAVGPKSTWEVRETQQNKLVQLQLVEVHGKDQRVHAKFEVEPAQAGDTINVLKSRAAQEESQRLNKPLEAYRSSVVEAGGFVVSARPPMETNLAYRFQTQTVTGYQTVSTPQSQAEVAKLATKAAQAVSITYTRGDQLSSAMISTAVENKTGLITIAPPTANLYAVSVEKQVALYSHTGRDIANTFGNLSATAKVHLNQRHAQQRISGETGDDLVGAAARIASRLQAVAREQSKTVAVEPKTAEQVQAKKPTQREVEHSIS